MFFSSRGAGRREIELVLIKLHDLASPNRKNHFLALPSTGKLCVSARDGNLKIYLILVLWKFVAFKARQKIICIVNRAEPISVFASLCFETGLIGPEKIGGYKISASP